jgi:hypothetical protein
VFFLKRIGIALFSTRRAFRRYKVAGFNRGYFSSSDSFISRFTQTSLEEDAAYSNKSRRSEVARTTRME